MSLHRRSPVPLMFRRLFRRAHDIADESWPRRREGWCPVHMQCRNLMQWHEPENTGGTQRMTGARHRDHGLAIDAAPARRAAPRSSRSDAPGGPAACGCPGQPSAPPGPRLSAAMIGIILVSLDFGRMAKEVLLSYSCGYLWTGLVFAWFYIGIKVTAAAPQPP